MVLQEIQLKMSDLASKIEPLSYMTCNGYARTQAWMLACLVLLELCAKFYIV